MRKEIPLSCTTRPVESVVLPLRVFPSSTRCPRDTGAAEGESQWVFFNGNYQEYEADKKKRLGEEAARPHRIRFKPLKK